MPAHFFVGVAPFPERKLSGRNEARKQLCAKVTRGEAAALRALNGLPGVGKTTLAPGLACDVEVTARVQGGIECPGRCRAPGCSRNLSQRDERAAVARRGVSC